MDKIKKNIKKIEDTHMYGAPEILALGLIVDTTMRPSRFTLYRFIRSGALRAVNLSAGTSPRYVVSGKDLREFVSKRYNLA